MPNPSSSKNKQSSKLWQIESTLATFFGRNCQSGALQNKFHHGASSSSENNGTGESRQLEKLALHWEKFKSGSLHVHENYWNLNKCWHLPCGSETPVDLGASSSVDCSKGRCTP